MKKLSASALLLFLVFSAAAARAAAAARLPFIEDDYAKALSEAGRRRLPVFVDVWAPW